MNSKPTQTELFDADANILPTVETELEETWKFHPEFPDYEFSNLGRARSYRNGRERYFRGGKMPSGHRSIEMQPGRHQEYLSKIIAKLFLEPSPSEEHVVRHLNGDPEDNRAVNLAYGTPQQNSIERHQHAGTYTGKRCRAENSGTRKHKIQKTTCELLIAAIRERENSDTLTIPMSLARKILDILKKQ